MKKDLSFYWKLFMSTFTLSAFTFGGGYVIVPLMRKKFVENYKWIEEEEMLDLVAIAQSSPGPIAVNTSMIIGYKLAGLLGAMTTVLGTVLPPIITISIISLAYTAFKESTAVSMVLRGMQAGVAAVITDVVIKMSKDIFKLKKAVPVIVMFAAFILAYVFKVNVAFIIIGSALLGAASVIIGGKKGGAA